EIVACMVPWIMLQFIASPVSMVLHVTGLQHWAMTLQIVGLVLRTGPVLIAALLLAKGHVSAFIIGSAVFYLVYLGIILKASGIPPVINWKKTVPMVVTSWLPWVLAGVIVRVMTVAL